MDFLSFTFRIGVILAIYGFLWWFINMALKILRRGKRKQLIESYSIKLVRYAFLADVIFLFSRDQSNSELTLNNFMVAGLILMIYFVGKIQSKQHQNSFLNIRGGDNTAGVQNLLSSIKPIFDIRFEVGVVVLSMLLYVGFYFAPDWSVNPISNWFLDSILNIEETPVFGFIFKVVGFFFLLSVLFKIVNGFFSIFNGGKRSQGNSEVDNEQDDEQDDDHFDDYTEIK